MVNAKAEGMRSNFARSKSLREGAHKLGHKLGMRERVGSPLVLFCFLNSFLKASAKWVTHLAILASPPSPLPR